MQRSLMQSSKGRLPLVRSFDEASQNARQTGKRKLRWPVAEVVVVTSSDAVKNAIDRLNAVCMDRANARKVSVVMGHWDRIGWHAEPVMKALGKGFGKDSFKIKGLIEAADGNAIKAAVDAGQDVHARQRQRDVRDRCGARDLHRETPGRYLLGTDDGCNRVRGRGSHS